MTDEERVKEYCVKVVYGAAYDKYQQQRDQLLYDDAVMDLSHSRKELLVSDAYALCGSPFHTISRTHWSETAWKFLAQFTKEGQDDTTKTVQLRNKRI